VPRSFDTPTRAASAYAPPSVPPRPRVADDATLEAATTRRVTRHLMPLLFILYVVCFLDRTNVGFAALQMNRDLGFGPAVYGLGAGIFFLGYALFEVPGNMVLARVGARRWLGRIAISWGAIAAAMMFVREPQGFYAMRFLLGVAEAGFFPGVIYYLTQWFPERQRARAMSRFMVSIPIAGAVGGALGGLLLGLDGRLGLAGWQWLFLLEGLPAVVLGFAAIRWLPDKPQDARWLPENERAWLLGRLAAEARARSRDDRSSLRTVFTSPVVWWLATPYFLMSLAIYALILWQPTLVSELAGLDTNGVAVALTASGLAGAVAMLLMGVLSDRSGRRVFHAAGTLLVAAAGASIAALATDRLVVVVALIIAASAGTAFLPVYWCVPPRFLSGSVAAVGVALINSLGNLGGFAGPAALGAVRGASGGFTSGLLAIGGTCVVAALVMLSVQRARSEE
jgi:MFS transporter, ACS family, tartrate transporter